MHPELTSTEKRQLLAKLIAQGKSARPLSYSLSQGQTALWYLQQLFPHSAAYNETFAWRIAGKPDTRKLKSTAQRLCQHHSALRTTYHLRDDQIVAIVNPNMEIGFDAIDACSWSESQLHQEMHNEANQPIDLEQGPVFRLKVFRRPDEQIWLTTVHHIAIDLWSMIIVMEDLRKLLVGNMVGQPVNLPPAASYDHFSQWQAEFLKSDRGESQRQYWHKRLTGIPRLELPTDRPHPKVQTFRGGAVTFTLNRSIKQQLDQLCKSQKTTLYTVLLAAFELLLARYSGQDQFMVGSITSGRSDPAFERTVGFLANPAALPVDCTGDPSFVEFLKRTRQVVLGAIENQDYPFSLLVDQLVQERDLSRPPLASVAFILQNLQSSKRDLQERDDYQPFSSGMNTRSGVRPDLDGIPIEIYIMDQQHAKFDLRLEMIEAGSQITGIMRYNVALFDVETVDRMVCSFQTLVSEFLRDPSLPISQLEVLTPEKIELQTKHWNATQADFSGSPFVHELISAVAKKTPQACAIEYNDQNWTYAQLESRTQAIAHQILSQPDAAVGSIAAIYMPRSPLAIQAILASWRVGLASLPLDISYPAKRLAQMFSDACPAIVLTDHEHYPALTQILELAEFAEDRRPEILLIDDQPDAIDQTERELVLSRASEIGASSAAYLVYTSGTTGRPKGVVLTHAALRNLLLAQNQVLDIQSTDRIYQFSNLCFDASIAEIVQALGNGATLILPSGTAMQVGEDLWQQLEQSQTSLVTLPPSILATLPIEPLPKLRTILVAGEACSSELASIWSKGRKMFNAYGPSEAGVCATIHPIDSGESSSIIGRPIANVQIYIADQNLKPVPVGVPGELLIGGPGVGTGYIHRPELTEKKFVTNPFCCEISRETSADSILPIAKLFRTGDRAKYLPDGRIQFLGRADQQVKFRGFRIELEEIESVLMESGQLSAAVVLVDPSQEKMVACVVAEQDQEIDQRRLLDLCVSKLPSYMVPSQILRIDKLPLGLNGKLDRTSLAKNYACLATKSDHQTRARRPYVQPQSKLEEDLCKIFEQLLGLDQVGIHESFFELGGHSLLAVKLTSKIKEQLDLTVPLHLLLANPTVAGLARCFQSASNPSFSSLLNFELAKKLRKDAELDSSYEFNQPRKQPESTRHVLLTGATGFLGVHLLCELLKDPQLIVHCLVRADTPEAGLDRIKQRMQAFNLPWNASERIIPVLGDLAEPRLGLKGSQFDELARTLDAIYHNGAYVNFVLPYEQLRQANVEGTRSVLNLAGHFTTKSLHYVSTLSVFPLFNLPGQPELIETSLADQPEWLLDGYAQSKWVAEQMVLTAGSRGLPISVYRPGRITAHSQLGLHESGDLLSEMIQACIQLGHFPKLDMPIDMTPVDYVSRAIVALSNDKDRPNDSFHLLNSESLSISQIASWLRTQGLSLQECSPSHWVQLCKDAQGASGLQSLLSLVPDELLSQDDTSSLISMSQYGSRLTYQALASHDIHCPQINETILDLYFGKLCHRMESV